MFPAPAVAPLPRSDIMLVNEMLLPRALALCGQTVSSRSEGEGDVPVDFLSAASVDETLEILTAYGDDAVVLAGGSAIMYQLKNGIKSGKVLVHVEKLANLSFVHSDGAPKIGALTSLRKLAESDELADHYSGIRSAAASCGGWQIQSVATIGGNVCNASPSADLVPSLLAHGARLTLASKSRGSRTIDLGEFLVRHRQTERRPDELLTTIDLDAPAPGTADIYIKVRRRGAMELPIIGLAVRLTLDESGETMADVRVAVCSAGPVPFRATEAEDILKQNAASDDVIAEAGAALLERAAVVTDARASAEYRRAVLPRVLARAVKDCAARASGVEPRAG